MTRLRGALRYWKVALLFAVVVLASVLIPSRQAPVVDRSACVSRPSVLYSTVRTCPLYSESYHGGILTVAASVSRPPAGSTDNPGAYPPLAGVSPGFHPWALLAMVGFSVVAGAALTGLAWLLNRSGRLRRLYTGGDRRRAPGLTAPAPTDRRDMDFLDYDRAVKQGAALSQAGDHAGASELFASLADDPSLTDMDRVYMLHNAAVSRQQVGPAEQTEALFDRGIPLERRWYRSILREAKAKWLAGVGRSDDAADIYVELVQEGWMTTGQRRDFEEQVFKLRR